MNLKQMIKYRSVWMGFAMIWIMFYHTEMSIHMRALNRFKLVGYGGVDIFLFAAGVGNYYSYLKDESPLDFMKRRLIRLAPAYIPFIIMYCIYSIHTGDMEPGHVLGNLTGIQGFSSQGNPFNWYITGILLCYFMTPYFASLIKRHNLKENMLFLLILLALTTAFWGDRRMIVSVARLPVFALGMLAAKHADYVASKKFILLNIILGCVGWNVLFRFRSNKSLDLWGNGLHWYPFILIVPMICILLSLLAGLLEKNRILNLINCMLTRVGNCSFELYLIHVFVVRIMRKVIPELPYNHNMIWLIVILFCYVLAELYRMCIHTIMNFLKKQPA